MVKRGDLNILPQSCDLLDDNRMVSGSRYVCLCVSDSNQVGDWMGQVGADHDLPPCREETRSATADSTRDRATYNSVVQGRSK